MQVYTFDVQTVTICNVYLYIHILFMCSVYPCFIVRATFFVFSV